ncbi:MAG: exodeoxyribonuclease VII large subunit [Deltaproteobacteria bacterium]|nr:exodeoxyribonuclease VII large subunit [Deltaproteobacteria bacterium]
MDLFQYADEAGKEEKQENASSAPTVLTVSQVTVEIKHVLAQHFLSKNPIIIEGEVSNYRGRNSAGHMYFSLKDDNAVLPCVFFRFANAKCNVSFKEGSLVQAKGKIEVYEKGGRYQFVLESLREKGQGKLYEEFVKLKQKLQTLGLFEQDKKKPIPAFPKRVGVVTSATGSVIKDIIHVVANRAPVVDIVLFPCQVQGDKASEAIVSQIKRAQDRALHIDTLIVGRGGGSIEDLWPFNEENVAYAIAQSTIPVISAVGHQTDFTICDFVADQRAATPSQAAEFAVPNLIEMKKQMDSTYNQLIREVMTRVASYRQQLDRWTGSPMMRDPRSPLYQRMQYLDDLQARLKERSKYITPLKVQQWSYLRKELISKQLQVMKTYSQRLDRLQTQLTLLDPTQILSRGYSIVKTKDKKIISHLDQVKIDDTLEVVVADGGFECIVSKV